MRIKNEKKNNETQRKHWKTMNKFESQGATINIKKNNECQGKKMNDKKNILMKNNKWQGVTKKNTE